jgi:hypothetical protein
VAVRFSHLSDSDIHRRRVELYSLRFELAFLKLEFLLRKANFDPEQPRDDQGRWTDGGGRPKVPKQRPPTAQLRNRIVKEVAKWLVKAALREAALGPVAGTAVNVLDAASWLYEYYPYIRSYLDTPKSLDELQQAVSDPQKGYDIHHIVEQTPAAQDGFPRWRIDAPDNLVSIPTLKHWEISGWYQTRNKDFGGLSPREYLQGRTWEERVSIGRDALMGSGVLKP